MRRVYFDNNASSPVLPPIFEAMRPWLSEERFGNPSSIHRSGQEARSAVERSRESVAKLLGCRAAEVVFTSGGTEGDNLALFGMLAAGDHLICSTIEHDAILNSSNRLRERGCELTRIAVDARGLLNPDDIRKALRPNTKLISIMMANNETGVLQPVEEIGTIAAEADVYFHTDAVQAAAKVPIDIEKIGCDLLSISGHKMHAPQGVGAIYVRKGTPLSAMAYGGKHERSRRAGTENVPGIVALGAAAEFALHGFQDGSIARLADLRDRLQQAILKTVDATGINGEGAPRVPNTASIHFDDVEGEAMVIALDLKGLAVSTGAACSSGAIEPSHVLTAMGLSADRARGTIRFSLGKQNTAEDVEFAINLIPQTVSRLRELAPKAASV